MSSVSFCLQIVTSGTICRVNQIEFPSSLIYLAVCIAGASSACVLVIKLALSVLYYKFTQLTNIFMHIFT